MDQGKPSPTCSRNWTGVTATKNPPGITGRASHLHNGDLGFRAGESRIFFGLVNFSELCTNIHGQPILARRPGLAGTGRCVRVRCRGGRPTPRPFRQIRRGQADFFVRGQTAATGISGPTSPAQLSSAGRSATASGKFDTELKLNNEHFYCSELVELAFRHAGLPLSQPVRIDRLPHFEALPTSTKTLVQTYDHDHRWSRKYHYPATSRSGSGPVPIWIWSWMPQQPAVPPPDLAIRLPFFSTVSYGPRYRKKFRSG